MLDTVVISSEDVCCSVVFGTMDGVSVVSVMWSELLMTSAIRGVCGVSPVRTECGIFVMCSMQCCMSVSTVL